MTFNFEMRLVCFYVFVCIKIIYASTNYERFCIAIKGGYSFGIKTSLSNCNLTNTIAMNNFLPLK